MFTHGTQCGKMLCTWFLLLRRLQYGVLGVLLEQGMLVWQGSNTASGFSDTAPKEREADREIFGQRVSALRLEA